MTVFKYLVCKANGNLISQENEHPMGSVLSDIFATGKCSVNLCQGTTGQRQSEMF